MLVATWVLAGATALLALTSLVVVITWRENRRRDRENYMENRILEAARKEFSARDEVGGLKSNLAGFAVLGGIAAALFVASKLDGSK
jgi:hypothetical protein